MDCRPRHIMYVTGTRADYGLMVNTLRAIDCHPRLHLSVLVTGMHLSEEFGKTVQQVTNDGFEIRHKIDMLASDDSLAAMAKSVGTAIVKMADAFEVSRPDFVLLEGDRGESLAAAIAAAHMNIAVAHTSGGDVTGSIIDESIRHSITKFAHLHFPGTPLSAKRVLSMGEDPWRIHMVGTPGADLETELDMTREEVGAALGLDVSRPVLLVLQHPVSTESGLAARQMRETMEAACSFGEQTVVIFPNADAGGREMIDAIKDYEGLPNVHVHKSLPRPLYVGLLSVTTVMIGNSSSAFTDAPNFALPSVNVGSRQRGRERGGNLIDAGHARDEVREAIEYALSHLDDEDTRRKWRQSPYKSAGAPEKIAEVLGTVKIGAGLIQKQFNDGSLPIGDQ